jgi:dTDP-4-dehydrorhamnose 3,5-epimerase
VHVQPTDLDGVLVITPVLHGDERGSFAETFRADLFQEAVGHPFTLAQANTSTSRRGVVRGVHFALVPPGQAKYVQCPAGRILDLVIDLRTGSPTYAAHVAVELDDQRRQALYIPEGYGHAFCALSDRATLHYLCSTPYAPEREFAVHPLDPELALPWPPDIAPTLSARDAAAPTLAEAAGLGQLPTYAAAQAHRAVLRGAGG